MCFNNFLDSHIALYDPDLVFHNKRNLKIFVLRPQRRHSEHPYEHREDAYSSQQCIVIKS